MKIVVVGDLHGDVHSLQKIIKYSLPDVVLQVGDMSIYYPYDVPVYFIAGNHERFDLIEAMDKKIIKINNLYHIQTGQTYELKQPFGDLFKSTPLRVAGINGNYSPSWKKRPRHFTKKDVEECKKLERCDIFLSHEAPEGIIFRDNKDLGAPPITEIMKKLKPRFLFFGHHHKFTKPKKIGHTVVTGLGLSRDGYALFNPYPKLEIVKFGRC